MNKKALYHLTYGLYLLTAREGEKDNGCIINTAVQVANEPLRLAISVIKKNYTCDMILRTGVFNISAITDGAEFALFQHFGMQSGRDVDKFAGFTEVERSENGLYYLTQAANMYLSARVAEHFDLGSHMLFLAEVTDGEILSKDNACTYAYYQSDIKPKPKKAEKKQWVCSICGYVYEGEELPEDYLCPLCKHGKEDFEPVGEAAAKAEVPAAAAEAGGEKKWVCSICKYVHTGDRPPVVCPLCGVSGDLFELEK